MKYLTMCCIVRPRSRFSPTMYPDSDAKGILHVICPNLQATTMQLATKKENEGYIIATDVVTVSFMDCAGLSHQLCKHVITSKTVTKKLPGTVLLQGGLRSRYVVLRTHAFVKVTSWAMTRFTYSSMFREWVASSNSVKTLHNIAYNAI